MAMSQQDKTNYKRQFNDSHYERVGLYLKEGEKEQWQKQAKTEGMSLNEFIRMCVNEHRE